MSIIEKVPVRFKLKDFISYYFFHSFEFVGGYDLLRIPRSGYFRPYLLKLFEVTVAFFLHLRFAYVA